MEDKIFWEAPTIKSKTILKLTKKVIWIFQALVLIALGILFLLSRLNKINIEEWIIYVFSCLLFLFSLLIIELINLWFKRNKVLSELGKRINSLEKGNYSRKEIWNMLGENYFINEYKKYYEKYGENDFLLFKYHFLKNELNEIEKIIYFEKINNPDWQGNLIKGIKKYFRKGNNEKS